MINDSILTEKLLEEKINYYRTALELISGNKDKEDGGWPFPDGPVYIARNALAGKPVDELY